MEKETTLYELGYILNPRMDEEAVKNFTEKLRVVITEKGGLIMSEGAPKNQVLAYPIRKETSAVLNSIKFLMRPQSLKDVKEKLEKESEILRFILVKAKERTFKPWSIKSKIRKIKPAQETLLTAKNTAAETPTAVPEEELDKKIEELLGNEN